MLDETGQYEAAIDAFSQALKLDRNADTYYNLGQSYMAAGSLYKAQDAFKESIKLNPENEDAYRYLINCLADSGMRREAEFWKGIKKSRFGR